MRGATRTLYQYAQPVLEISIHAPHAGCDPVQTGNARKKSYFNPRTPCGVRLAKSVYCRCNQLYFNPRTPCGVRLQLVELWLSAPNSFQSTHPMRGATYIAVTVGGSDDISIHAPHAGCDLDAEEMTRVTDISIHAPHAGCDKTTAPAGTHTLCHFNPRTPCGVRRADVFRGNYAKDFNPRTPCGVRRVALSDLGASGDFNPRTPCGVRLCSARILYKKKDFNPRTPCGVRLHIHQQDQDNHSISIHAPHAGCDIN